MVWPKKRKFDEFLPTMMSIFTSTKWFGIPVYGGHGFLCLTISILLVLICIEVMAIWKLVRAILGFADNINGDRGVTARLSGAIFYANTLISLLLIWRLLRTWKSLSKHWLRVETKGLYLQPDRTIKRRVISVTCFVTVCAFVEHGISMMFETGFSCQQSGCFKQYILKSHSFMLHSYEYSLWVAIPIFITSNIGTILWNFQDLIVILISMGLASRYHRLNTYLKYFVAHERRIRQRKVYFRSSSLLLSHINTWRKLREAYVQQGKLVRKVDEVLGGLTILCNLNNFFFICLQLFLILRKSDGAVLNDTYYTVSLTWLALRASIVVLTAADVNLHSKRALDSIYNYPSSGYNLEIKRLKYYLMNDNICLTGLGIFFMNRQTLLEVAAAIIKYELILISFDT